MTISEKDVIVIQEDLLRRITESIYGCYLNNDNEDIKKGLQEAQKIIDWFGNKLSQMEKEIDNHENN